MNSVIIFKSHCCYLISFIYKRGAIIYFKHCKNEQLLWVCYILKHQNSRLIFSWARMHIFMIYHHLLCYKRDFMNLIWIVLTFSFTIWHEPFFHQPINCEGSNASIFFLHTNNDAELWNNAFLNFRALSHFDRWAFKYTHEFYYN